MLGVRGGEVFAARKRLNPRTRLRLLAAPDLAASREEDSGRILRDIGQESRRFSDDN